MTATQWVILGVILVLIIAYPIAMMFRNKKETEKVKDQANNLKKGDKVLTTSGVYGTVVEIVNEGNGKIITLETGTGKNKGYISIDSFAIYTVFNKETEVKAEPEATAKEVKEEIAMAEEKEEVKPAKKTTSKSKSTSTKTTTKKTTK